jgi:hypothetical protein
MRMHKRFFSCGKSSPVRRSTSPSPAAHHPDVAGEPTNTRSEAPRWMGGIELTGEGATIYARTLPTRFVKGDAARVRKLGRDAFAEVAHTGRTDDHVAAPGKSLLRPADAPSRPAVPPPNTGKSRLVRHARPALPQRRNFRALTHGRR